VGLAAPRTPMRNRAMPQTPPRRPEAPRSSGSADRAVPQTPPRRPEAPGSSGSSGSADLDPVVGLAAPRTPMVGQGGAADAVEMAQGRVVVTDLPASIAEWEVREIFGAYGPVGAVAVHEGYPASANRFAFVDYETGADAETAVRTLDGVYKFRHGAARPIRVRLEGELRGRFERYRDVGRQSFGIYGIAALACAEFGLDELDDGVLAKIRAAFGYDPITLATLPRLEELLRNEQAAVSAAQKREEEVQELRYLLHRAECRAARAETAAANAKAAAAGAASVRTAMPRWTRRESRTQPGRFYYYDAATGTSSADPPPPWTSRVSQRTGLRYFVNLETHETSVELPMI